MPNFRAIFLSVSGASLALGAVMMAAMTAAQPPAADGAGTAGQGAASATAGRAPLVTGTVTETDPGVGSISVASPGGEDQSIRVTAKTRYSTQVRCTVADLKVNDMVQVQGVPTGIAAESLLAGDLADLAASEQTGAADSGAATAVGQPKASAGASDAAPGPGSGSPSAGGAAGKAAVRRVPASAVATGRVVSISPLTIAVSGSVSIVLKVSPSTRISKIVPTTFLSMKRGDRLVAAGQAGEDGLFTATTVGVNLDFAGPSAPSRSPGRTPGQVAGRAKPAAPAGDSSTEPDAPGAETNATVALGLLQKNCACHDGSGRGPDLSHEGKRRSATWLKAFIADPKSKNPASRMPAMGGKVSSQDIAVIADYLAKAK